MKLYIQANRLLSKVLSMRRTIIVFILAVIAAIVVAGCTSSSPTVSPTTSGTASTAAQPSATTSASNSKEKSWPVLSSHAAGPGSVHGTLTLPGGKPAANYAFYLWNSSANPDKDPAFVMVRTDANGKYSITGIPNDKYKPRIPFPDGSKVSNPSAFNVYGDKTYDESI
jgi:hypothetical protein